MRVALVLIAAVVMGGCSREAPQPVADYPRAVAGMTLRDVTFHSAALDRAMKYRVYVPEGWKGGGLAVYLLHGGDIGELCAGKGWLLIMPEGGYSYYTNSVARPQDRYEDYIMRDLPEDVERRFQVPASNKRAIVGVSMGGFGAIKLGLKYPQTFLFSGSLSGAVDVPRRRWTVQHAGQWFDHEKIFGPQDARQQNDPFALARAAAVPAETPYFYLWAGEQEPLAEPNREFATILEARKFRYKFHTSPGGHDWGSWNRALGACIEALGNQILTPRC